MNTHVSTQTRLKVSVILFLIMSIFSVAIIYWEVRSKDKEDMTETQEPEIMYQTFTEGPGLGQCHWIGGEFTTNPGLRWAYSGSTPFNFASGGGDTWAAVEQEEGVYNFTQQHTEVQTAKNRGKNMWLHLSFDDMRNKEHNLPKWLLDLGADTYTNSCGDLDNNQSHVHYAWDDGTNNSVKPIWENTDALYVSRFLDKTEATLLDINGNVTTDLNAVEEVVFPVRLGAVWDPLIREKYANVLGAMNTEFRDDLDDGTIQAVDLLSGGQFGEHYISAECEIWNTTGCTPDVMNPDCPVIQSMARIVQNQLYPTLTVDQVANNYITKKSNCSASNVIPGSANNFSEVQLCADQANCPKEYSSYCYVFDDYFIQAEKMIITIYAETFYPTPVVWQTGSGLSHSGRTTIILQSWMNETYGAQIWMKFNGWGPRDNGFWTRNFDQYTSVGASGYEPDYPGSFSKSYFASNAQSWCNMYLTEECNGDTACLPNVCTADPLDTNAVGRFAIATAIKKGIVEDTSSYLCMQSTFFQDTAVDNDPEGADGLLENTYFFNPDDQTETCATSEINTTDFGVGFCPGYLNHIMEQNVPVDPTGTCTRNCTDKACGTDGCGGSCGTCPTGQTCNTNDGICQSTCTPSCSGRECGSDGCTSTCGTCTTPETCTTAGVCAQSGTLRGDLNADGKVSVSDYALFITDYLAYIRDAGLNIRSDLNGNGTISVSDYAVFIQAYMDYMEAQ